VFEHSSHARSRGSVLRRKRGSAKNVWKANVWKANVWMTNVWKTNVRGNRPAWRFALVLTGFPHAVQSTLAQGGAPVATRLARC
jgi:hypothetical protein